jgi:two-component sensor histidine kinase
MGAYLTTLLDQVAASFRTSQPVKTLVNAEGVMLDLPRATPAGLIINELVTNSFKYAFPESSNTQKVRSTAPVITVDIVLKDGIYVVTVADNGIGLPAGFDPSKSQSLGLKLVTFLAKHQLRATIEVRSETGTEFVIRFAA